MKNKLNKILLVISFALVIIILLLAILGSVNRIGYLSELKLNKDLSKRNAYNYNFRIKYYSSIFRNSDIYGGYIDINKVLRENNYIKDIKVDKEGSPFGTFTYSKELKYDDKIYINYKLKLKIPIWIVFVISIIYILFNYKLIFNVYSINEKLILKASKISSVSILAVLLLFFILGKLNHKSNLTDLELIGKSKEGYIYKARVDFKGLFSPNFIYKSGKLKFENKADYIKYGYNLEINTRPWYDIKVAKAWNNEDGTFTMSNSTSFNGYSYNFELSKGEKYIVTLEAKKLSENINGIIKYHLNSIASISIPNTDNMTDDYKKYISELEIKKDEISEKPAIRFSFPKGIINIKYIKIDQVSENLYLKSGNSIAFTSLKKIDDVKKLGHISYKLNISISFLLFILIIIIILNSLFIAIDFLCVIPELLTLKLKKFDIRNKCTYIVIIFLSFLIIPNIIYQVFYDKFDHTNYENRKFADKPKLDIKKLDNYPKLYEAYFNDNTAFRNEFVQLKNISDIFIFKNVILSRAILGKEKWLFHKDEYLLEKFMGIETYSFTVEELGKIKSNLLYIENELKKRNIDFIFMLCSSKHYLYPEYLPNYIKSSDNANTIDYFIKYLKTDTDLNIIYTKDELLKYKDKYQLYYKYDGHWNRIGGYIGYMSLMKTMNIKNFVNMDDLNIYKFDSSYRDGHYNGLAGLLSLNKFTFFNDDIVYYLSNYSTNTFHVNKSTNNYYNTFSDSINNKHVLMIGDSFRNTIKEYFASSFSEFTSIHIDELYKHDIFSYNPDIIILESYEVRLKNRLLNLLSMERFNKYIKNIEN